MFQKLHSDETETIAFFSSFISIIQQKPPGSSHTMQLWVDFVQEVVAASGKYEKLKR